ANLNYIFEAMEISGHQLDPDLWMIINPMNKEIYWDPNSANPTFKDPNVKLRSELKLRSNDLVTMTPLGEAKEKSEIKKYNVIIRFL
ncbi:MAG: hypothetical protein ACTSP6_02570, partial [Promethearchaeota archaeon]